MDTDIAFAEVIIYIWIENKAEKEGPRVRARKNTSVSFDLLT